MYGKQRRAGLSITLQMHTVPNIEVTALCVDRSGYRMATGAADGMYNFLFFIYSLYQALGP